MSISFDNWKSLLEEGYSAHSQGRLAIAEEAYAAALKEAESWPTQESPEVQRDIDERLTKSLNNMAAIYQTQGKYKMAEGLYLKSLSIKKRLFGEEHDDVALAMLNLGMLYSGMKDYEQAENYLKQSLTIREKALAPDHPNLAKILQTYATFLRKRQRYKDAEIIEARIVKSSSPSRR